MAGNYSTFFPQSGAIDNLSIVLNGKAINIKSQLVELSYYEDIFSFFVSGYIKLKDAFGLVEKLQLTGKESIVIDFGSGSGDPRPPQTFRLYSVPKRTPINLGSEMLEIHFCSEELFLSEQIKITKSYNGKEISTMIDDILTNDLKIGVTKNRLIQQTVGKYSFIVPTRKPFETISWLSTYALPSVNSGADMLFYETAWGFYFKSLGTLYQSEPTATYKYDMKNVTGETLFDGEFSVLDFEFVKTFDALNDVRSGTFANRLISLDPIMRTRRVTDFDYEKYKVGAPKLNPGSILSTSTNRLNKKQNEAYTGTLKLVVGNSEQKSKLPENIRGFVGDDIFIEKTIPNRTAQLALINHTKLKMRIPGNSLLSAGDTINFNLVSYDGSQNKQLDKFYSGKYLVTAIRHYVTGDSIYQAIVEVSKESTPTQLNSA